MGILCGSELLFLKNSKKSFGYVKDVLKISLLQFPVVEFEYQEEKYHFIGNQNKNLAIGEVIEIRFNPQDPSLAKIDSIKSIWKKVIFESFIVSLIWFLFISAISDSMLTRIFYKRKRRNREGTSEKST